MDLRLVASVLHAGAMGLVLASTVPAMAADDPLQEALALGRQAVTLYGQRRYDEAEAMARRSLELGEAVLGSDHPTLLLPLQNLGEIELALGRYADAAPLEERALSIQEKSLGSDHLDLAKTLDRLAQIYLKRGRRAEAEASLTRALAIREKALGPDHPNVAQTMDDLADLYWILVRHAESDRLKARAAAIRAAIPGPDDGLKEADAADAQAAVLYRQGRYADAEPLEKRAVAIRAKVLGPDDPAVAVSLAMVAVIDRADLRYADAERFTLRALVIREKALGPDHPLVATTLKDLARLDEDQGRYADAETLFRRALEIREKTLGPDHIKVAESLDDLAGLFYRQGRYGEAAPLYERAVSILETARGADHPDVAAVLNNLAAVYLAQARYGEAEPLFKRALAIRETALGPDHLDVANSLHNLAAVDADLGRYREAEPLYRRALAIRETALGTDHPLVAHSLGNLASVYQDQGHYREAEPLIKRALAIQEKVFGPDHPEVAGSLNNLASLYRDLGRYADAEPLLKRSLAIFEKALGPDTPEVATAVDAIAGVYGSQGRNTDAEPLIRRALAIREKVLGPDHPDVAVSLNNLSGHYEDDGRYTEAEPLRKRALAILEKALGAEHPFVATGLENLAELYVQQNRVAEAEPLFRRALAIHETAFGPDHPGLAGILDKLGFLYAALERYDDAQPLVERALAIQEKALGADHPDTARSLDILSQIKRAQGDLEPALSDSARSVEIIERHLADSANQRSGAGVFEQRSYRDSFLRNIALIGAVAAKQPGPDDGGQRSFRVAQLAQSSSAAQAVAGMAARFAAGSDALAAAVRERQDTAERWRWLDAAIVKAAGKSPGDRNRIDEADLRAARGEAGTRLDALDRRIAKDFPAYADLSNPKPLDVDAVRALLAPDEALLMYLVGDKESWVWAVRRDRVAWYRLDIGRGALAREVAALRERLDPQINPDLKPFPALRAYALHQKILAPATPLLGGIRHILIVPDGALQSLPIGVLVTQPPTQDPVDLADNRDIAWFARDHAVTVLPSVGSLRALRTFASNTRASSPFAGIGNPVLTGPPSPGPPNSVAPAPEAEFTITPGASAPLGNESRGLGPLIVRSPMVRQASLYRGGSVDVDAVRALQPLPETADELRTIAQALGAGPRDLYLGERASEPLIRQADLGTYQVIEFATHGLMSGDLGLGEPALVLTPPAVATADDDGLLTASKIATLSLNAEWVVLSACNTAAGDGTPDAGGLTGLAKAFFYAGARSLLVSHWSVPSVATVKLTTGAFAALKAHPEIGRAEALRRSMMAMLDPRNPPAFSHPLAWAPFVLAGEGGAGR